MVSSTDHLLTQRKCLILFNRKDSSITRLGWSLLTVEKTIKQTSWHIQRKDLQGWNGQFSECLKLIFELPCTEHLTRNFVIHLICDYLFKTIEMRKLCALKPHHSGDIHTSFLSRSAENSAYTTAKLVYSSNCITVFLKLAKRKKVPCGAQVFTLSRHSKKSSGHYHVLKLF